MQITSKSGKIYEMTWRRFGYTFVEPIIVTKKDYLFGLITLTSYTSLLNWANDMSLDRITSAYPNTVRNWLTSAVNRYEDYLQAWEEEKLKEQSR